MKISEYTGFDALGLAALMRGGEVSAAEVRTAALEALSAAQSRLNCLVELYREPSGASLADSSAPLFGVPFLLKDLGAHQAGTLQEMGSRLCAGYRNAHATFLAQAYEAAGLEILGRSTAPEFGYNTSTETLACGPTRNPWNPAHSPGGSSGGSSAAVAFGAVPAAHANDGGGSIRIPAAYCGLVGLKPSRGRISVGPDVGEALLGMGCEHVVTRTIRDSAALLDVTAGPRPGDPFIIPPPPGTYLSSLKARIPRLKVGLATHSWEGGWPIDRECAEAARRAAELLATDGHEIIETKLLIDADAYLVATARTWCSQLANWADRFAAGLGRDPATHLEPALLACYRYGKATSATDLFDAIAVFNDVCRKVGELFRTVDVLVTPTTAQTAPRLGVLSPQQHADSALEWTAHLFGPAPFTATFNTTGQPAISLPLAMHSNGLPIGVQIVGRFAEEERLLQLGAWFEQSTPWNNRRPLLNALLG